MPRLLIDCEQRSSSFSARGVARSFAGQHAELHLLLAMARESAGDRGGYVSAEQLHRVGRWKRKKGKSVGTEVSAHLDDLASLGLGELIEWLRTEKTSRWRLSSKVEVVFRPSKDACERWLAEERARLEDLDGKPAASLPWLRQVSAALIDLQRGRIPEGLISAGQAREIAEGPLLKAIAELIELRLKARLGDYPGLSDELEEAQTPLLRSIRARAELAQALDPRFSRAEKVHSLLQSIEELEDDLPDVNGVGLAYNAIGVLLRRGKDWERAARYFRDASALVAATSDLPTLASAVYNLGLTLYEVAKDKPSLEAAREAILVAVSFQERLNIGKDFAFGEVVLGYIELHLGRLAESRRWLRKAKRLVGDLSSGLSLAAVKTLEARVAWAQAIVMDRVDKEKRGIRALYQEAIRLREEQHADTDDLEKDIKRLASSLPPEWFRKIPTRA